MRTFRGAAAAFALLLVLSPPQPVFAAADDPCVAAAKAGSEAERGKILAAMPDEEGCDGPITVYADPSVTPTTEPLPGFERDTTRPVAAMRDADGVITEFVADEILVGSADETKVKDLAERWKGTILAEARPDKSDVMTYTIRVRGDLADPKSLSDNLAKLNEGRRKADSLAVSSKEALGLLTIAAQEAVDADGMAVGVNWLLRSASYASRSLAEAGVGPTGFTAAGPYDRDPYKWNFLNSGSVQDIGVTEAWTQMDSVGLLGPNKVDIAILDKGFSPVVNGDIPPGYTMKSMVPFADPGDPSPESWAHWHGTNVANAAAGVPGNYWGAAGPAGPVGRMTLTFTGQDLFTIVYALIGSWNVQLINLSSYKSVHWAWSWTMSPMENVTVFLHTVANVLIFAAAGNDGDDVDRETCFLGCWEKYLWAPCELAGVTCVGGLKKNSLDHDPNSNYGHEDVDVFAPWSVLVGPDPVQSASNTAYQADGTSVATPYALGVAALIWAANPGLDNDEVLDILLRHLRTSPDPKVKQKVITALTAVRDAMPATIRITTPQDGWILPAGSPSPFAATVYADGNGTPTVTWRANGAYLGTGLSLSATPPLGAQTITATAVFPNGVQATDSVQVTVYNGAPTITITNPTTTSPAFGVSEPIPFHAVSNDEGGPLADSAVQWFLDSSTTPFATGHNPTVVTGGAVGTHTVKVRGCDPFNVCVFATVPITLVANPVNQPPIVHITSPANGAHLWVTGMDAAGYYWSGTLSATATDPEGFPLTTRWYDNGVLIGTGPTVTARLTGGCGIYSHVLSFTATDPAGNTRQDTVNTTVEMVC
ncbi:MAG: S8 family serine peptidase [Hamadaea sp.]|nr:S8 family serine peptidase [Hamadaea sp.]